MNRRHVIPGILAAIIVVVAGAFIGVAVGKIGHRAATTVVDSVIATGRVVTTTDHGKKVVVHLPAQTVTRDGQLVTLAPTTQTVNRTEIVTGPGSATTATVIHTTTQTGTTTQTVPTTLPGSTITITLPATTTTGPTTTTETVTETETETITTTPGSGPPPTTGPPPST